VTVFLPEMQVPRKNQRPQRGRQPRARNAAKPRPRRGAAPKGRQRVSRAMGGGQRQAAVAAAYATGQVGKAPVIHATRDSSRIVHRELIDTVIDSVDFSAVQTYALNPGLSKSLPWLSSQAQGWESYRFNRLRYCYYTRTGSTTVGSLMLVPDYNASNSVPQSEQIASSYEDCAEDSVWKDIVCELRVKAMDTVGPRHFVRNGAVPSGSDPKLYDVGNLFVCSTVSNSGGASIGKLWVEYDVTFSTPQLPPEGAGTRIAYISAGGGSIAAATPFGAVPVITAYGLQPSIFSGNQFDLADESCPSGEYQIVVTGTGTVITAVSITIVGGGHGSVKTVLFENFPAAATTFAAVATVNIADHYIDQIALDLTATTITACDCTLFVQPSTAPW